MKNILFAALAAAVLIGCDNSNPADASMPADAEYNETSMYKTTVASQTEAIQLQSKNMFHDSLRHGKMLGTMKRHVQLTEAQFESVKVYGKALFDELKDIRSQVQDSLITKEQARELVIAARAQFIDSVKSILTEEQVAKFEEWIVRFWNKHHGRPPGRGHHQGPGGGRP
ncbi:MAG: hypothetical protein ACYC09_04885 [Bacteroidota bacterium]